MAMNCAEYREIAAADVDGELTADERRAVEGHVPTCPRCTAMREEQHRTKALLQSRRVRYQAPPPVRQQIVDAVDREMEIAADSGQRWRWPLRVVIGGAIAATLALVLRSWMQPTGVDLLATLVDDVRAADAQTLRLAVNTSDVEELRRYYRQSANIDFEDSVEDLSAEGLRLVGGKGATIDHVPTTLSLYEGVPGRVVCRRFRAGALPLPEGGEWLDESTQVFTADGVTVAVIRSGDIVCCMATSMPRSLFTRHLMAAGEH